MTILSPLPRELAAERALRPDYAREFLCIGGACEDTCCEGWTVKIDEASYHRYRALPPGPVQDRMRSSLVQIGPVPIYSAPINSAPINSAQTKTAQTRRDFAEIRMRDDGVCPFLDPDRLCSIQREYGAEYLSSVCSQYPRTNQTVEGRTEQTLLLSCPSAARLVLLHPQLLPWPPGTATAERYRQFIAGLDTPKGKTDAPAEGLTPHFWSIREFALTLLQDRSYPVWQRLFLLGMMAKRLDSLGAERRTNECPQVLREYAALAGSGSIKPAMDQIPPLPVLQLTLVMHLLAERARMRKVSPRFDVCLERFMDGLGCKAGRSAEALTPAYVRAFQERFRPWREAHPLVLENYLLNAAMSSAFPIGTEGPGRGLHPWNEQLRLSIHYGLIQGLLIGMAAQRTLPFGADDAILLIQSFVKTFEHNTGFIDRVIDLLRKEDLNNSRGLTAFVRDPD